MPGARERLRESWTRGKRINQVKYRTALKRQAEKLLKREIRHISSFFPYDINKFHNENLIYMKGLFLSGPLPLAERGASFNVRLINLITGLELLSIGTSFHIFKAGDSNIAGRSDTSKSEKDYTLELLFGDIFYSRAVIYLLRFKDYKVFDSILEALKKLHESRLRMHLVMHEVIRGKRSPSSIDKDRRLLIDTNRLLRAAFEIGESISACADVRTLTNDNVKIHNNILIYKTYVELISYLGFFQKTTSLQKIYDHLDSGKKAVRLKLKDLMNASGQENSTEAIKSMLKSLEQV